MSTIADLESKIAQSQDVLDFYTNKLKNTNLPNSLREQYKKDITYQEERINDLKQKLENKKRSFGNLSLERPASPLPYSTNRIMSPKVFTDKFDNHQVYNDEMMPTTPNSANSANSANSTNSTKSWFENLKSYNPFKGGAKKRYMKNKKSKKMTKKHAKKTRKHRR